ncbi:rhodanese-related sulfurtransferase [Azospirillum sp. B21]|uniref:rhodanese-like domain-containing protein n=1 Tax=Azospirillum sp. B21 TaxID=2607496 RepID=UPI0011EFA7C7|nr:rhodanese-like domain-containing protein [Azospirillum sp. B21]KAA0572653.1 rhodanese-related sulfurtransferase [Azospirillum sp. B21]
MTAAVTKAAPFATRRPADIRRAWIERDEVALLDAREEGPYSLAHPLFSVSVPLSRVELLVYNLLPRHDVPITVYDDGEGYAEPAARRLQALGYSDVTLLEGGLAGWIAAGFEVYRDVNVPSKAFGEWVEHHRHTPSLSAAEVKALIDARADLVILDARRFEEYRTMSIPGGISVPGAELVKRVHDIAPNSDTLVVVNCAGRTRSIIGTQSLVNAGIPNRVAALRNGTIGWTLAGLTLDSGNEGRFPDVSAEGDAQGRRAARAVADRAGVGRIDATTLDRFRRDERRTLHLFDVRTPEEYEAGHLPGFRHAAGGQLVQATDEYVAVRGARIVLADDPAGGGGPRADMTASWLAQLGWEVHVLEGDVSALGSESGPDRRRLPPEPDVGAQTVAPRDLLALLENGEAAVIDITRSPRYRAGHIPGAYFSTRARLAETIARLPKGVRPVLTCGDGTLTRYAVADFPLSGFSGGQRPLLLEGGTKGWVAAGLPLSTDLDRLGGEPDDVYKRPYEGTDNSAAAMQGYIDWELELVDQLKRDGAHNFHVI